MRILILDTQCASSPSAEQRADHFVAGDGDGAVGLYRDVGLDERGEVVGRDFALGDFLRGIAGVGEAAFHAMCGCVKKVARNACANGGDHADIFAEKRPD